MDEMFLERLKDANPIQDVIAETEPLRGQAGRRYFKSEAHDSLAVDAKKQYYDWNSKHETGDVLDWVIRYRGAGDFRGAVEMLCRRAGLPVPEWGGGDAQARIAARAREDALQVYAKWAAAQLQATPAALAYANGRGWTMATVTAHMLGYSGEGDKARKDLRGELSMHGVDLNGPGAKAVLGIPQGMLIYPHVRSGRVRYLSARGVAEKRHYNLLEEHAGPRQVYANAEYAPGCDFVVVVEGQADAITCAQWGWPAIALAGTALGDETVKLLRGHRVVYWGTDADAAGATARKQARQVGPLTRLLTWPAKDANDWLQTANPSADECKAVLTEAATVVEQACADARGDDDAILDAMRLVATLPADKLELRRESLAMLMGVKKTAFNALLKQVQEGDAGERAEADEAEAPAVEVTGPVLLDDGTFLDVLYDTVTDTFRLAVRYPDGRLEQRTEFEAHGLAYKPTVHPYVYKEVQKPMGKLPPAILMPAFLPDRDMTIPELHAAIISFAQDYLDVDQNHLSIAAYYVMLTWLYDCFWEIGYLRAMGPMGKGKSRYVSTLGVLCYRAMFMLGLSTLSPLFRIRDLTLSTLILDELNGPFVENPVELEMYFNAGMSVRSPRMWRSEGKDNVPTSFAGAYGPKIFGCIKAFRDPATNSRCMTAQMTVPTTRTDIKPQDTHFDQRAQELRNQLMRFRMKYWRKEWEIQRWNDPAIEPRLRQITEPLLTIIGDDEKTRLELQAVIRQQNSEMVGDRNDSITGKVVRALAILAAQPLRAGKQGRVYRDARLKTVYEMVGEMVFDEEEAAPKFKEDGSLNVDSERNNKKHWYNRNISPRKMGEIVRRDLGLNTIEADWCAGKGRAVDLVSDTELSKLERLKAVYGAMDAAKKAETAETPGPGLVFGSKPAPQAPLAPEEPPVFDEYLAPVAE